MNKQDYQNLFYAKVEEHEGLMAELRVLSDEFKEKSQGFRGFWWTIFKGQQNLDKRKPIFRRSDTVMKEMNDARIQSLRALR